MPGENVVEVLLKLVAGKGLQLLKLGEEAGCGRGQGLQGGGNGLL